MNKMRSARGFFRGTIDGASEETGGDKGGKPFLPFLPRSSEGGGKGKDKGRHCFKCGRFDHLAF